MKEIKKTEFLSNEEGEGRLRKILKRTGRVEEGDLDGAGEIRDGGINMRIMMEMMLKTGKTEIEGQIDGETGARIVKRLKRDLKGEMREIVGKGGMMMMIRNTMIHEDVIVITEVSDMTTGGDGILIEGLIVSRRQGRKTEIRDHLEEEMMKKDETIKTNREEAGRDLVTGTEEVQGWTGDRTSMMERDRNDKAEVLGVHKKTGEV